MANRRDGAEGSTRARTNGDKRLLRWPLALVLATGMAALGLWHAAALSAVGGASGPPQFSIKTPAQKIHPLVLADTANGPASFIVTMAEQADVSAAEKLTTKRAKGAYVFAALRETALRTQAPILQRLASLHIRYRSNYINNSITVIGGRELVNELAANPLVDRIDPDRAIRLQSPLPPSGPAQVLAQAAPSATTTPQWNIQWVKAPAVWTLGYTGQGMVVAGADTGVQWDHPVLRGQYRGWNGVSANHNYNWWDAIHAPVGSDPGDDPCGYSSPVPCDDNGHGTHTLGTAVGNNGYGVAPGARWIACRNLEDGVGRASTYLECLEFFLAPWDLNGNNPNPSLAPDVINNSWACPPQEGCSPDTLRTAVGNLRAAGIMVVVAAGNSGPSCSSIAEPAAIYDTALSVGALSAKNNFIAAFSSRGPVTVDGSQRIKPDIVAPGTDVVSAYPPDTYNTLSGTSMAAPHVAGGAALLLSVCPNLRGDVAAIEAAMTRTALGQPTALCGGARRPFEPNNLYGYGTLNLQQAANLLLQSSACRPTGASATVSAK
jgi:serine protease AprX